MGDSDRIRELNDALRQQGNGGKIVVTHGVSALSGEGQSRVMQLLRAYNDFGEENDPHKEHDFGAFECEGHRILWKIDYYDKTEEFGSEDPSDPEQTHRVLTVMLAEEY